MIDRQSNWLSISLLAVTLFCAILALLPPSRAKARAQRIQTVNHLAGSSLKLPPITLQTTNLSSRPPVTK